MFDLNDHARCANCKHYSGYMLRVKIMDKNSKRNDLRSRLFALVILFTIILIYNNFLVSRNHQKEEQIKREKEMVVIRRQKE